ncbi:retrovirus-related Pol polyprotein from transposon 412 [Trichonephila clavipes]|nr:retrovirus-related Pol polyprotein from transposon 412 [Trichonephila clavipes]
MHQTEKKGERKTTDHETLSHSQETETTSELTSYSPNVYTMPTCEELVILNHGQVTKTTPELAPHLREAFEGNLSSRKRISNVKCCYINSRCNLWNFECKPTNMHALCHTGAECHFVVWSSPLVVSIVGRSVLAVDDAGVAIQCYSIRAQLEKYLVISQAMVTCQYSVEHVALQQWCENERPPPSECCL